MKAIGIQTPGQPRWKTNGFCELAFYLVNFLTIQLA